MSTYLLQHILNISADIVCTRKNPPHGSVYNSKKINLFVFIARYIRKLRLSLVKYIAPAFVCGFMLALVLKLVF